MEGKLMVDFDRIIHPHIVNRRDTGPVQTKQVAVDRGNAIERFNAKLALAITRVVGTMWCAYVFAAWDLLSLPASVHAGLMAIVQWVAGTFLQLVLLSIIMVGQEYQSKAADEQAKQMYNDIDAILHELQEVHRHLDAQDAAQAPGGSSNPMTSFTPGKI
jgi:hypothetical protein